MTQQQQPQNFEQKWKRNFGVIWSMCLMHQRALTVPMRSKFGVEALGRPCAFALILLFAWSLCTGDPFMWLYTGIWLFYFAMRRIEAIRLNRSGAHIHSQYDGWPAMAIRLGRKEHAAKLIVEPAVWGALGWALYVWYQDKGVSVAGCPTFFLTGLFTLPFVELVKKTIWEKKIQATIDARVEQEVFMFDFKNRYGE